MANEVYYKADIKGSVDRNVIEALVSASGGIMLRLDQDEQHTAVFFAGSAEAADETRDALVKDRDVSVSQVTQADVETLT